jgi:nucleotide-binding universal stress UspA family protein
VGIVIGTADPVVVGVDGSTRSIGALRWAAAEAARLHRRLRIIYALDSDDPALHERAESLLDDAIVQANAWQPRLAIVGVVQHGTPVAELLAESEHAELVVLGSRGHGTLAGILLGSVSAQVAAHAHCPVLVVHHGQIWAGSDGPPTSGRPVVVGVDGSAPSDLAAGYAFQAAAALGVSLVAVRAWNPVQPHGRDETAEHDLLAESVAGWCVKYPDVPVRLLLVPDSGGAALVAASQDAQLAVVGSRGHDGFLGLLLGSTSQQLLHHAHCPVLVVRPRDVAQPGTEA